MVRNSDSLVVCGLALVSGLCVVGMVVCQLCRVPQPEQLGAIAASTAGCLVGIGYGLRSRTAEVAGDAAALDAPEHQRHPKQPPKRPGEGVSQ